MMKVYVLIAHIPYESSRNMAVFSSLGKAKAEQEKQRDLWPGEYIDVDEFELDKVPE